MSPAMHRRSPMRRRSPYRSDSPTRNRPSPRRRSSPRRERSPDIHRSSARTKSPVRTNRARSPTKEKLPVHGRSPKHERYRSPRKEKLPDRLRSPKRRQSRSPVKTRMPDCARSPVHARSRSPVRSDTSCSPSPHSKRLRRARAERDTEKLADRERERGSSRDHEKGRHKDRIEERDVSTERRSLQDKNDGQSSRSSRRDHSVSPARRSHRSRYNSASPSRSFRTGARDEATSTRGDEHHRDGEEDSVAKMKAAEEALEAKQKQQPSFELSGKLAEETNRVRGVTLLFTEPPDARKPDIRWRLYVFKAGEVLNEPLYVHRQSCYLFGRERRVADIPTDHPSCSKQHAVIQYRLVEKEQPDGLMKKQVRPYIMDLGSTNGTFINDECIEPQRYYELCEKDTIKFGNSSREYVMLHENSVQ